MPPWTGPRPKGFRWQLTDEDDGQAMLFAEEELVDRHVGMGEYRNLEFLHVNAKRVINEVPASSRLPFRHTINAYRGCSHACTYCFARPTHEYLGLNIGEDFERKLVVKVNAVERVRAELRSPKWKGDPVAMGTNTDPYQRAEGRYHLTRGIIEALGEARNPFSILTKSTLVLRDLDVLSAAAERTDVHCNFSIGTLDEACWRATEPGTPHPRRRVDAVRRLNDAGIPTGVLVAPVIPGLSDRADQLEEVVEACIDAGAVSISAIALHLRGEVKEHFLERLRMTHPEQYGSMRRRYRGAYLATSEQEHIANQVRVVIGRRRDSLSSEHPDTGGGRSGTGPESRRHHFVTGHESAAEHGDNDSVSTATPATAHQLSLTMPDQSQTSMSRPCR